jgi:type III pantothenate kinase
LLDTDRVRFAEEPDYAITPGHSTAHAVRHGIALAQAGALLLALDSAVAGSSGGGAPQLLFCGGGGEMLQSLVARGGVLVPDLVFEGLEVMHSLSQQ